LWNAVIANIIVHIQLNDRGSHSSPLEQQYSLPLVLPLLETFMGSCLLNNL